MFMFMGPFSRMFDSLVASSSSVRGSGTLQCGVRAYVVAWASMGHEEPVSRGRLPEHSRRKSMNDRKLSLKKKFLSDRLSAHRNT